MARTKSRLKNPAKRPRVCSTHAAAFRRLSTRYTTRLLNAEGEVTPPDTLREALQGQVAITPRLQRVDGGFDTVLKALRGYDDPDAAAFLAMYDQISESDRAVLSWEEISVAAGVDAIDLYGVCSKALLSWEDDERKHMLATGGTKVLRKTLDLAMKPRHVQERLAILKGIGVVPLPKGSQYAIQINQQAPRLPEGDADEAPALPDGAVTWDQETQIRRLHEAWGERQKQLPPPKDTTALPPEVDAMQQRTAEILREEL